MVLSPVKLFVYALAFRFSSGRGRCFSPGIKAMLIWYGTRLRLVPAGSFRREMVAWAGLSRAEHGYAACSDSAVHLER